VRRYAPLHIGIILYYTARETASVGINDNDGDDATLHRVIITTILIIYT